MERNLTLDYSRLLLAFFVIIMHVEDFLSEIPILSFILKAIGTSAVPCFFVINGYYFEPILRNKSKYLKYLKHLLIIYIVWSVFYIHFMLKWKEV